MDQPTVSMRQAATTAEEFHQLACDHEEAGRYQEAVHAYRQALLLEGPNPMLCFNLGNALCSLGKKAEAIERYYQAVEMDGMFAEAWNNLGVALADQGRTEEAQAALAKALAANPDFADAHYNLADLLDETDHGQAARAHWEAYLTQDQHTQWATHAQACLAAFGN